MQLFKSLVVIAAVAAAAGLTGPALASVVTDHNDVPASERTYSALGSLIYSDGPNTYAIGGASLGNFSGETETPVSPGVADIAFNGGMSGGFSANFAPPTPMLFTGPFLIRSTDLPPSPPFSEEIALEMLQMNLVGGGMMLRESPTLASLGHETHENLGGGLFRIDSFFDIFTELSLDGGQTWMPSQNLTRFDLTAINSVPEPLTAALFGIGLLGLASLRRRNG